MYFLIAYLAGYPVAISGIRPDTGYKKGRIIWPDIRCIPSHKINAAFVRVGSIVFCFQLRTALYIFLLLLVQCTVAVI